MKINNLTQETQIATQAKKADSFISRMVGLLKTPVLNSGEALIITRCSSIHMFFMKFPIDVIFVDKNDSVVGLVENIKPFQMSRIYFKASYAIELPVGSIQTSKTQVSDSLNIE